MKMPTPTPFYFLCNLLPVFGLVFALPSAVLAAPITGDPLNSGLQNTVSTRSGAIGNDNVSSDASLAVGSNNSVSCSCSVVAGAYNYLGGFQSIVIGNLNSFSGGAGAVFGVLNQGVGNYNLMAGFNNRIYGATTSETAVFGNSNSGTSLYDCLVSGTYNVLTGARDSAAIGRSAHHERYFNLVHGSWPV